MLALEFQLYGFGTVPFPASFTEQGPFSTNSAVRVRVGGWGDQNCEKPAL
jgi:hypothetical protein